MSEHRDKQSDPVEANLKQIRAVSLPSFALLVSSNQDNAYRFALHFTGNKEDAEEVARDVFVDIWDHRRHLSTRRPFNDSLYASVARVCSKWAAGRQATINALPALSLDGLHDHLPTKYGDSVALDLLERDMLAVPLELMPASDRLIVLLRFLGGFNAAETAKVANIRIDEVRRRTKRGLRVIADHLGLAAE